MRATGTKARHSGRSIHNGHALRVRYGLLSSVAEEPRPPFPKRHTIESGAASQSSPRPLFDAKAYGPSEKLIGKVALITGAESGIGRAVALAYAREGADVAILYHSHDADAEETRQAVEGTGRRALTIRGDVSEPAFCKRAAQRVVSELGQLDILVSTAAVQRRTDDVQALERQQFERTFQVNVFGYFFMVQACLPFMRAGGSIIATGSATGIFGSDQMPDYSATQGAIHALTRSLALQLLPKGIRVNAIAAGPVGRAPEPSDPGSPDDNVGRSGSGTGLRRPAQLEDIVPAYVFFASNADSSFTTGQVLAELGGTMP